jgi:hypothetical protein
MQHRILFTRANLVNTDPSRAVLTRAKNACWPGPPKRLRSGGARTWAVGRRPPVPRIMDEVGPRCRGRRRRTRTVTAVRLLHLPGPRPDPTSESSRRCHWPAEPVRKAGGSRAALGRARAARAAASAPAPVLRLGGPGWRPPVTGSRRAGNATPPHPDLSGLRAAMLKSHCKNYGILGTAGPRPIMMSEAQGTHVL